MVAKGVGDAAESGQAWTVMVETAWGVAAVATAAKNSTMDETIFIFACWIVDSCVVVKLECEFGRPPWGQCSKIGLLNFFSNVFRHPKQ